ncbi:hypothetical protein ACFSYE_14955 [Roseibacillus ishigakijimensis]
MKLLLQVTMAVAVAAGAMSLTSCGGGCCTGEEPVPGLRPLPTFDEPAPVVDYSK